MISNNLCNGFIDTSHEPWILEYSNGKIIDSVDDQVVSFEAQHKMLEKIW